MFKLRFTTERQPLTKNGQPAHNTTGVLKTNCPQRDTAPLTHSEWLQAGTK